MDQIHIEMYIKNIEIILLYKIFKIVHYINKRADNKIYIIKLKK
jgi:hypothetical protein